MKSGSKKTSVAKQRSTKRSRRSKTAARTRRTGRSSRPTTQRRQRARVYRNVGGEFVVYNKRELWLSLTHTAGQDDKGVLKFRIDQYPPWLKRLCSMYEYIRPKYIAIIAVSDFPMTASGTYFMSYNASKSDTEAAGSLTPEKMSQQQYAVSSVIYRSRKLFIPTQVFRLPTKGDLTMPTEQDEDKLEKSWYFDFQYLVTSASGGTIRFFIDYKVELITPTIRN